MKTIKFNLILDDKPVRNIEQLRDNFSVEDILETYKNGLLKKWLKVRGYNDYLSKVQQLNKNNDKEIIKYLINIFEMDVDEEELDSIMNQVDYINKKGINDCIDMNLNRYEFSVEKYHKGYEQLIDDISQNKDNIGKLKAIFEEIDEKYINLFKMSYWNICKIINKDSIFIPLIMMSKKNIKEVLLEDIQVMVPLNRIINDGLFIQKKSTNEYKEVYSSSELIEFKQTYSSMIIKETRRTNGIKKLVTNEKILILDIEKPKDFNLDVVMWDKALHKEEQNMNCIGKVFDGLHIETRSGQYGVVISYIYCCHITKNIKRECEKNIELLPKYIKSYNSKTEGFWKEIENKNKKIMIIDIDPNSKIKSVTGEKILEGKEIKDKFIVLNGLEYNSDSNEPLIYMEV